MSLHYTYAGSPLFTDTTAGYQAGTTIGVRNQVRALVHDTGIKNSAADKPFMLADEEIDFVQTQEVNAYMMAARCCDMLIVALSGGATSKTIGDLSTTYDLTFYQALRSELVARGLTYQEPFCGGLSIVDRLIQDANPDAVQPMMFRGEFNNPGASQPTPGATNPLTGGPGV